MSKTNEATETKRIAYWVSPPGSDQGLDDLEWGSLVVMSDGQCWFDSAPPAESTLEELKRRLVELGFKR